MYERVRGTFDLDRGYGMVTFSIVRQAEAALRRLAEQFELTSGSISLIETAPAAQRSAGAFAAPLPLVVFAGEALARSPSTLLEAAVTRFRSEQVTFTEQVTPAEAAAPDGSVTPAGSTPRTRSTGYLLSQSIDLEDFSSFARQVSQADPTPDWVTTGRDADAYTADAVTAPTTADAPARTDAPTAAKAPAATAGNVDEGSPKSLLGRLLGRRRR